LLEQDCRLFFVELHDYESSPGAIRSGIWRTRVAPREASFNVRADSFLGPASEVKALPDEIFEGHD
jgi:hypothetical protein